MAWAVGEWPARKLFNILCLSDSGPGWLVVFITSYVSQAVVAGVAPVYNILAPVWLRYWSVWVHGSAPSLPVPAGAGADSFHNFLRHSQ